MPEIPELAGFQRKHLREKAHGLRPIVEVGEAGITDSVVGALAQALRDHELVKVRLRQPADKREAARRLSEASGAALCGLVGHTVILYRPDPEQPRIAIPTREAGRP